MNLRLFCRVSRLAAIGAILLGSASCVDINEELGENLIPTDQKWDVFTPEAVDLKEKILFGGVSAKDVELLEKPDGINLAKLAASWSDGIIVGSEGVDQEILDFCKESGLPMLDFNAEALENGSYIEDYNSFYDNL